MVPSLSIGPRTLLNDCNHSATAIFWRSAITMLLYILPNFTGVPLMSEEVVIIPSRGDGNPAKTTRYQEQIN